MNGPPILKKAVFQDTGQIDVQFLGTPYVIGCVEGEESRALEFVKRFEIDAGEVTKAVSAHLDNTRAMLMAGVLAYEQIEELEQQIESLSSSDRTVELDHNSPDYLAAIDTIDALIVMVRTSNSYREEDAADQERRVFELSAGRTLLNSRWVSTAGLKAILLTTLTYLSLKFLDAPIADAANAAWQAIRQLTGFLD